MDEMGNLVDPAWYFESFAIFIGAFCVFKITELANQYHTFFISIGNQGSRSILMFLKLFLTSASYSSSIGEAWKYCDTN